MPVIVIVQDFIPLALNVSHIANIFLEQILLCKVFGIIIECMFKVCQPFGWDAFLWHWAIQAARHQDLAVVSIPWIIVWTTICVAVPAHPAYIKSSFVWNHARIKVHAIVVQERVVILFVCEED